MHTDNGWNQATQTWFYSNLMTQGTFLSTDFDIMGFSFYPFYGTGATLANLKATLEYMIFTYGKDVIIAETDFPNSCSGVTLSESSIPTSAAGQTQWVNDVTSILEALPNSHGKGMFDCSFLSNVCSSMMSILQLLNRCILLGARMGR